MLRSDREKIRLRQRAISYIGRGPAVLIYLPISEWSAWWRISIAVVIRDLANDLPSSINKDTFPLGEGRHVSDGWMQDTGQKSSEKFVDEVKEFTIYFIGQDFLNSF